MPKPLSLKQLFLFTLLPGFLYLGLFFLRPLWFHPICGVKPEVCTRASVNGFDQLAFRYGSVFADFCSNILQNGVGVIAFLLPWLLRVPTPKSLRLNLVLLSLTAWNGVLIEVVRALVQRPRPLVYASPLTDGANIHQYTSFYSGHTSFVTLALFFSFLWVGRVLPAHRKTRLFLLVFFALASIATGALRVIGGRHYPTDVIAGMVFGVLVVLGVLRALGENNSHSPDRVLYPLQR
ncbi:MAG: phosphatase PAP2 family protein [Bdellovibrionales bacterium]|nr:phosphatase PAP2 family protein [Bdellovibrionales bacterium]